MYSFKDIISFSYHPIIIINTVYTPYILYYNFVKLEIKKSIFISKNTLYKSKGNQKGFIKLRVVKPK